MFDVGFWEIAIICLIALMILGPERLPRAARSVGLWVGKARRTLAEVKRDIDRELDASDLKDVKSIKAELTDTKTMFKDAAKSINVVEEVKDDLKETEAILRETTSTLNEDATKDYETVAVKPEFTKPESKESTS